MIHSTSSSPSHGPRPDAVTGTAAGPAAKPVSAAADQIHIDKAAVLRAGLLQVPEIRPEVVERARALAADPAYPADNIISQISAALVNSPDLSEERS